MLKKILSSLVLGAFVFGLGAAIDVQPVSAASKSAYEQKKPKPNVNKEQTRNNNHGKKQNFR